MIMAGWCAGPRPPVGDKGYECVGTWKLCGIEGGLRVLGEEYGTRQHSGVIYSGARHGV